MKCPACDIELQLHFRNELLAGERGVVRTLYELVVAEPGNPSPEDAAGSTNPASPDPNPSDEGV